MQVYELIAILAEYPAGKNISIAFGEKSFIIDGVIDDAPDEMEDRKSVV